MKPITIIGTIAILLALAIPAAAQETSVEEIEFQGVPVAVDFFRVEPGAGAFVVHLAKDERLIQVFIVAPKELRKAMRSAAHAGKAVRIRGVFDNLPSTDGTTLLVIRATRVRILQER